MFLEKSKDRIETAFEKLCGHQPGIMEPVREEISRYPKETALAMKFLYGTMPISDIGNYPCSVYRDFAEHGVKLWENYAYVRELPEELYLNNVLLHRVNNEEIEPCRSLFYESILDYGKEELGLEDWLSEKSTEEIALEVNFWCAREATYQSTDGRTASALTVFKCGRGRCGEESTFAVNALRSVGLPARQVYAPYWSHCDDNHAWVEVYAGGRWHFLGACEPDRELDYGWFNAAASRAMMVHSRWSDTVIPEGEKLVGRDGIELMLDQLRRYADTAEIEVRILDETGSPVPGATVEFQVLNFSMLGNIATVTADSEGKVCLETGLGSLHIQARKDGRYGEALIDVRKGRTCVCGIRPMTDHGNRVVYQSGQQDETACRAGAGQDFAAGAAQGSASREAEVWTDFEMYAPKDHIRPRKKPTPEEKEALMRKTARMTGKRMQKTKHYQNPDREKFFYGGDIAYAGLRAKLLKALLDKDQLDLKYDVLEEHFEESLPYKDQYPEDIFVSYVMNPRISREVLMPWRKAIKAAFTPEEAESFREDPARIWEMIEKRIKEHPDREQHGLITTPAAALKLGVAGKESKMILFVAIARTFGIPARLNHLNRAMEYWKAAPSGAGSDGWKALPDETGTAADGGEAGAPGAFVPVLEAERPDARLILREGSSGTAWKYFQNWSLSHFVEGSYGPLGLWGRQWENGEISVELVSGTYRILTANRLPNGNLFAKRYDFEIRPGETKEVALQFREAELDDMLCSIALPEFALEDARHTKQKAVDLAAKGKTLFIWLEESMEPTEHILNELIERQDDFRAYQDRIALVVRSGKALEDPTLMKCRAALPEIPVYYHDFGEDEEAIARALYTEPGRMPLILIAETRESGLTALYGTSGYNVGTADMVLRILK